ncbi:hypothetical protein [Bartonella koehlerae]|uniref:Uncharacterized protein n=1 Tax=Bartonella koehlerae C-29 TaxID=1134510 RepID=A0A067WD58_9HYPH|nr:hypothetical protein [Bartonella koehlerae]KEC54748.1 hypothetical protein O9A_01362 [Bartonella koehlerae C-29]
MAFAQFIRNSACFAQRLHPLDQEGSRAMKPVACQKRLKGHGGI